MRKHISFCRVWLGILVIGMAAIELSAAVHDQDEVSGHIVARGGGTTIIQGGSGAPQFLPVITTIAFHAEKVGGTVSGDFECLAVAPPSPNGPGSGQFTVNVMYVTATITGAQARGNLATLTGSATITGIAAGSNVPFTLVVRKGGPGATAVLTAGGLEFREILVEGSFEVSSNN